MTNEIETISTDLTIQAKGLQVTDQASATRATELILAGKSLTKKIGEFFAPLKAAAKASWQGLVDKEKAELAKVEPVVDMLSKGISTWRAEEERKRRVAEEERLRIEREKKRLEDEALWKVKQAEEKAEKERLWLEQETERLRQEAAKTEDEAELKRIDEEREKLRQQALENQEAVDAVADKAIDEAAKAEAAMEPAPIIPEAPRTAGLTSRDNWKAEIINPQIIPREYLMPDEKKIGAVVRAAKGQITIPGVRIYNEPTEAAIGRRN